MKKSVKTLLSRTFWTIALLYVFATVLLHLPVFQRMTGSLVASALSEKLGTEVSVGRVDLGFLNRIVVDDVQVRDKQKAMMLQATRLAAKVDVLPLLEGRVRISSVQLFGLNANLYRENAQAEPNFQFVIDSFKSKSQEPSKPLDVQIQSLIIRNGTVVWNQKNAAALPNRMDVNHLQVRDFSTHIALYTLTDDTLAAKVKRFSLKERSGLDLRSLTFTINAGRKGASLTNFQMQLPQSAVALKEIAATYRMNGKKLDANSLRFKVQTGSSHVTLSDFAFLEPSLKNWNERYALTLTAQGTLRGLAVEQLKLSNDNNTTFLQAQGKVDKTASTLSWTATVNRLKINHNTFAKVNNLLKGRGTAMPEAVLRLGDLDFTGKGSGNGKNITAEGTLRSGVGDATFSGWLKDERYRLALKTTGLNLGSLLDNADLGLLACNITSEGSLPPIVNKNKQWTDATVAVNGTVEQLGLKGYTYQNIAIDGSLAKDVFNGTLAMNDANGRFNLEGRVAHLLTFLADRHTPVEMNLSADVQTLNLKRLNLTDALGDRTFAFQGVVDVAGSTFSNLNGTVNVSNFSATGAGRHDAFQSLQVAIANTPLVQSLKVTSDYGDAELSGQYDYATLPQTLYRVVGSKLPSLHLGNSSAALSNNHLAFSLHLRDTSPLASLLNIPLETKEPVTASGQVDERAGWIDATVEAPDIIYKGTRVKDLSVALSTVADSLALHLQGNHVNQAGNPLSVKADVRAANDQLLLASDWKMQTVTTSHGTLNARAHLFREGGSVGAKVDFLPSVAVFDNVRLDVQPSELVYAKNHLSIHRFEISNGSQHIIVNGQTTGQDTDSLTVDLQNLKVGYILDLVDFHAVDFDGYASGTASVKSLFHQPSATANLTVENFTFNDGQMGTLRVAVAYDGEKINIDAVADDGPEAQTHVGGYVSLKDSYLDLPITARGTRLQFLEKFCGSFLSNVDCHGNGFVRVFGTLKDVNLEGDVVASGTMDVYPLRTSYEMRNGRVHLVPNHVVLQNDTVYDKYGHMGVLSGELKHDYLRNLTYDINVEAKNLLAYDHKTYGNNTFYGTVFATGNCAIRGKSGELVMDVNAVPEAGSFIEYNAGYSGSLDEAEFIRWNSPQPAEEADSVPTGATITVNSPFVQQRPEPDIPSDMHINFLVNTNQNFTLRVLMDEASGDYIALNGDGVITASYFNKGAFQMFGNYNIDHGVYKLTIQNVIKKEFVFQPGSTIAFGGDPYNAALNLKGVYTVNGASLSDLQLGNSFTRNNVRVNCLMDIKGTPEQPTVDFGLDLPTLSSDAQAMVRSVINSEEDMNQQVLYLLAVGRFYPQGNNNATQDGQSQSQTSLAMQSLLSGTISQQINTVLNNVVKSNDWNFGANISTGDEGFSNAEYEGLLSGRMFNNRLLFNGQFGYRDNVNTNNGSFIGDFDLRYLLTPTGSFAVRVYNQTNDRYFTRNSLTTQGLGIILKKDFNGLKDLFPWLRRKSKKKDK